LPEIVGDARLGKREPSLRIWSAGCANGAEPYSIAITLAENAYRLRDWKVEIIGTDISHEMLGAARQGIYSPRVMTGVTESQRRRFFRSTGDADTWQIRESIRDAVSFEHHNLMRPMPRTEFDCVFIRNVMIYFDDRSKQTAVRHLISALRPGGYLLIGPSEGIHDRLKSLRRVSPLIYQKLATPRHDDESKRGQS
jgi:chemotaxis protein methyltransferase CheR